MHTHTHTFPTLSDDSHLALPQVRTMWSRWAVCCVFRFFYCCCVSEQPFWGFSPPKILGTALRRVPCPPGETSWGSETCRWAKSR